MPLVLSTREAGGRGNVLVSAGPDDVRGGRPATALIRPAPEREETTMPSSSLASTSTKTHYMRGALGLLALAAGAVGAALATPAALLLLIVTAAAWRGCPPCWAVGLMQTREAPCAQRRCRRAAP